MSSLAVVVWFRRNSMLDWPEASHTSPTSTSSNLAESPFCTAASVWPVAQGGMGGSVTLHFPLESVFVFRAVFPKVTVISLLGAAVPETGMFSRGEVPYGNRRPGRTGACPPTPHEGRWRQPGCMKYGGAWFGGYLRRSSSRERPVSLPSRLIRRVMMKTRAARMGIPMIRKPHQVMLPMAAL